MKKQTAVETGYVHLKLEQVVPSEVNPGGARKGIEELTASVKEKGIIQPIIVRPVKGNGHYEIVAGHRRFLAATARASILYLPSCRSCRTTRPLRWR